MNYNRKTAVCILLLLFYLLLISIIPQQYINIVYPLIILPSVVIAFLWGAVWAAVLVAVFTVVDLVFLIITNQAYLETGLPGFILGHFNVLLTAVVVGFVSTMRRKYKAEVELRKASEQKLEEALEQKELLMREMNHRVSNQLTMLAGMVQLQSDYMKEGHQKDKFLELRDRIATFALIHRQLYSSDDAEGISFDRYISTLIKRTSGSMEHENKSIEVIVDVPALRFSIDHTTAIGLIVTELLLNAYKHGFPGGAEGKIWVRLETDGEDKYRLTVENNGKPIPPDVTFSSEKSLGLSLVSSLASQIGGSAEIGRSGPPRFVITFPR